MDVTTLNINDTIGSKGITPKGFIAELKAARTGKVDLRINSEGGDILDGFAIYNAVRAHEGYITAHIDGLAASIASVIAVAADKVCIAKNGFMMIHNGTLKTEGDPAALRQDADVLEKFCKTIAQAYADKSAKSGKNKTVDEFRKAMEGETWFTADEAMAWGLVDEIEDGGDESKMAVSAMLAVATYEHAPPALRRFAAKLARAERGTGKGSAMDKLVCRDGKWYHGEAEVDGSDFEAAAMANVLAHASAAEKSEAKVDEAKARAEAVKEGAKQEREYRAMFSTVVESAKLDATAAVDFEKQFYGRSEGDLKFLASHAIGQRAKPVGEGAPGNGEGEALTAEAKAEKEIEAKATKRFSDTPELRRLFGLTLSCEADSPEYTAALKRYVGRERAWAKDQIKHGTVVQNTK